MTDPFPATHSLLAPDALLAMVARAYAIDEPVGCTLVRSYANDVYAVATSVRNYALKLYRAGWRTFPDIAWEVDVLRHLAAQDIPVAAPIARRDGAYICALPAVEGTRHAVLFAHAPGEKPSPPFTPALYRRFGRATGRIHRALDGFASPRPRAPLDLGYLLDAPLAALAPRLAHRPDDLAFLVHLASRVRARITELTGLGLDWGVCHGDLSLDNVHLAPDGAMTLYDFDSGGPGWRACDLFGIFQHQPAENWEAFLAGYAEMRALTLADIAAVPWFVAAMGIRELGHRVRNWAAWGGTWMASDALIEQEIRRLRTWQSAQFPAEGVRG